MQKSRIILGLGFFLMSIGAFAQTWSISDPTVIGLKAGVAFSLGFEDQSLRDQATAIARLTRLETTYNDKRDASSFDTSTNAMIAVTIYAIESTESMIIDLQSQVATIKASSVFFKYRIDGIESDLETEKKYLDEIQEDYPWLAAAVPLGGGAGYAYTAFMKMLLRSMEIRRNVMIISKEVANLNTSNANFVRK